MPITIRVFGMVYSGGAQECSAVSGILLDIVNHLLLVGSSFSLRPYSSMLFIQETKYLS